MTIAGREFTEIFFIIGIFMGLTRNLKLKREKEIVVASGIGILFSILLPLLLFFIEKKIKLPLSEDFIDIIENIMMILTGFFIVYVIFSIHKVFAANRDKLIRQAKQKLAVSGFDISLFLTIILLITREGLEIAFFTASVSWVSKLAENVIGLFLGLLAAVIIGLLSFVFYTRFPLKKIYRLTEGLIIVMAGFYIVSGSANLIKLSYELLFK